MLLIAHVHRQGESTEAEPVVVTATGKTVWLVLDDGTEMAFDAAEFRVALDTDVLREVEAA